MSKDKSTEHREKGNQYFKEQKFEEAIEQYSLSIQEKPSPQAYSNRAFCHLKLENYGSALEDAEACIKLDPKFSKGYYRKGSAHRALEKYKEAIEDFKTCLDFEPGNKDAQEQLTSCKKEKQRIDFEKAISYDQKLVSETIDRNQKIDDNYDGERLENIDKITFKFIENMIQRFKDQKSIPKAYVIEILIKALNHFKSLKSLVYIDVPKDSKITVCGDVHGQYYDLLNIFTLNGYPSKSNPYLFNGDFVDRGSFSLEVILLLLAFKVFDPECIYLTRGNHESKHLNRMYGFEGEVKAKLNSEIYDLFQEVFNWLPLCYVLNKKVMVVHGGLFKEDGVKLKDIEKVDRNRDIPDSGLMCDILWADPMKENGRIPNKRGVSIAFGPDVCRRFLDDNGLELIVRSHEVKHDGYEYDKDARLITVFSAPNYCDQMMNLGAYIHFYHDMKPVFNQFKHVPHPNVKPMQYAQQHMF